MLFADDLRPGHIVRLTTPYYDAARGIYTIVYLYRNGWLGVVSRSDGRRYDLPRRLCRRVGAEAAPGTGRRAESLD